VRGSIDVSLETDEALGLVEASFEADGGWTVRRRADGLLIFPTDPKVGLLDPKPEVASLPLPETLAVRVVARSLEEGGARVSAKITRFRVGDFVVATALDLVLMLVGGSLGAVVHGVELVELRRNRRGAKRRMVRLAIEPLVPHQRGHERGPFRR
jgi:hypothetical protein